VHLLQIIAFSKNLPNYPQLLVRQWAWNLSSYFPVWAIIGGAMVKNPARNIICGETGVGKFFKGLLLHDHLLLDVICQEIARAMQETALASGLCTNGWIGKLETMVNRHSQKEIKEIAPEKYAQFFRQR
jgi:hypothetical protein